MGHCLQTPREFSSTIKGNEFEMKMANHSAFSPCLARVRKKIEPLLNDERFLIDTEEKATEDKNKQIKTKVGFNCGP